MNASVRVALGALCWNVSAKYVFPLQVKSDIWKIYKKKKNTQNLQIWEILPFYINILYNVNYMPHVAVKLESFGASIIDVRKRIKTLDQRSACIS